MFDVHIILCVDADPDGINVPGVTYRKKTKLSWSTLKKRIPEIIKIADSMENNFDIKVKLNWFLRCDHQINELYGSYNWVLSEFDSIWKSLRKRGDEIGWHPHFWKWDDKKNTWFQEIKDKKWMVECLENGFKNISNWLGEIPAVRTGWGYHDNNTMNKLDQLGVKLDLSGLPSLKSQGTILDGAFCDYYNWETTSEKPYNPSKQDYRLVGFKPLKILEIPMTVSRDPLPYALYGKVMNKKFLGPLDKYPVSPIKETKKFSLIIKRYVRNIKNKRKPNFIGLYFHPTDLYLERHLKVFQENLILLPKIIKGERGLPKFLTANEAYILAKDKMLK
jgi:hypothetical protein